MEEINKMIDKASTPFECRQILSLLLEKAKKPETNKKKFYDFWDSKKEIIIKKLHPEITNRYENLFEKNLK